MPETMKEQRQYPSYPAGSHNWLKRLDKKRNSTLANGTNVQQHDLNIAVVGAGVGGLSAAIALKIAGFNVKVYEAASALAEIGAGIQVPPNSTRLLNSWGLEAALNKKSVKPEGLTWRRWEDGKAIADTRLNPVFSEWFGAPYYVTHRAHLHELLHDRVVELGVPVELNCRVAEYDAEGGSFTRQDGSVVQVDLIVAADGIKSRARRTLLKENYKDPIPSGQAAFRAAIAVADIKADPETAWIADSRSLNLWVGGGTHAMTYSIAGGDTFNMVLAHPETKDPSQWDQEHALEEMKQVYSSWDPSLVKLLGKIKHTQKWPIASVEIPDQWSSRSGKLVLLGDAAHAMLPSMASGAAMAVEDAATLAEILKLRPAREELRSAVDIYESLRLPRTRAVSEASYLHAFTLHYPDGELQEARDAAMRPEVEGKHFIETPNQWSDPMTQQYFYTYDPVEHVHRVVQK